MARLREILAKPSHCCALLLVGRLEAIGVGVQPRLQRLDEAPLALGDLLEPLTETPLCAIEILVPGGEPALNLVLDLRERLGQSVPQPLLALAERLATGLGEASFLLGERREGVGARAGECPLELGRTGPGSSLDDLVELRLRALDLAVDRTRPLEAAPDAQSGDGCDQASHEPRRRDRELRSRLEREGDPRRGRARADRARHGDQHPSLGHFECRACQRRGREHDTHGEDDLESSLERHRGPS